MGSFYISTLIFFNYGKMSIILEILTLICFTYFISPTECVFEVKAGVVMVKGGVLPFKYEMVGPAIDLAIERSEVEFGIRFDVEQRLHGNFCDPVETVGIVSKLHHQVKYTLKTFLFGDCPCSDANFRRSDSSNYKKCKNI